MLILLLSIIYLCISYWLFLWRTLTQWVKDLNLRAKVIKVKTIILQEENIGEYIHDARMGKYLLDRTQKVIIIKEKGWGCLGGSVC